MMKNRTTAYQKIAMNTFSLLFESKPNLIILACSFVLSGCLDTGNLAGTDASSVASYQGCASAIARSSTSIEVLFQFPSDFDTIQIYRDGTLIGVSRDYSKTSLIDSGLNQGQTYTYYCNAIKGKITSSGLSSSTATTRLANAPTFAGVVSATALTPKSIQVSWNDITPGVPAKQFEIYANIGANVNWSSPPRLTVSSTQLSAVLTNLGDGQMYSIGVRACANSSGVTLCDNNTAKQSLTLDDSSLKPTSGTITAVRFVNGKPVLTAAWQESDGFVKFRHIFRKAPGETAFTELLPAIAVVDPAQVNNSITVDGAYTSFTDYEFYVLDEDGAGNFSQTTTAFALNSGKLNPPLYSGTNFISALNGTNVESQATLTFKTVANETQDPINGASFYNIYMSDITSGVSNVACSTGLLIKQISVTDTSVFPNYTVNTDTVYSVNTLSSRHTYEFCIKTQDSVGNLSATSGTKQVTMMDLTPPEFVNRNPISLSVNAPSQTLNLSWNQSTASDISYYKVTLFKGTVGSPTSLVTLAAPIYHVPGQTILNFTVTQSMYAFANNETVFALVNACDNALLYSFNSSNNCTQFSLSQSAMVNVGVLTPPAGFNGIISASPSSGNEGEITVRWNAPTTLSDYAGFKIYQVNTDNSLTLMPGGIFNCPQANCANLSPSNQPSPSGPLGYSVTLSGLNAYRTYRIFVQGFNSSGLMSTLDPRVATYYRDVTTLDTTAPSFGSSSLQVSNTIPPQISWSAATDNQYDSTAQMSYAVYRKLSLPFSATGITNPLSEGTLVNSSWVTAQNLQDQATLTGGSSYFYMVCAKDASSNITCDGAHQVSYSLPDTVPPNFGLVQVLNSSNVARTSTDLSWYLSWTLSDNITATNGLTIKIYQKKGSNISVQASSTDTLIYQGSGNGTTTLIYGDPGVNQYYSYALYAWDAAGNQQIYRTPSFNSNVPILSVSSIGQNTGGPAGGQLVGISGTGFPVGSGATVWFSISGANYPCTSVQVYSSSYLTCLTPAATTGSIADVFVQVNGASVYLSQAFTYVNNRPCDLASNAGSAPFHIGSGTLASPYYICTPAQFQALTTSTSLWAQNLYFALGNNIDLAGLSLTPIGNNTTNFKGDFNGNGNALLNYTFNAPASSYDAIGLFGVVNSGNNQSLHDLTLVNPSTTTGITKSSYISTLVGKGTMTSINNIKILNAAFNILNTGSPPNGLIQSGILSGSLSANVTNIYLSGSATIDSSGSNGGSCQGGLIGNLITNTSSLVQYVTIRDFSMTTTNSGNVTSLLAASVSGGGNFLDTTIDVDKFITSSIGGSFFINHGNWSSSGPYTLARIKIKIGTHSNGWGGGGGYFAIAIGGGNTASVNASEIDVQVGANSGLLNGFFGYLSGTSNLTKLSFKGQLGPNGMVIGGCSSGSIINADQISFSATNATSMHLICSNYGGQNWSSINLSNLQISTDATTFGIYNAGVCPTSSNYKISNLFLSAPVGAGSNEPLFARISFSGCSPSVDLTNFYYDSTLMPLSASSYYFTGVQTRPSGMYGLSTSQAKIQSNFVGFDFTNIWKMPSGGGYPVLQYGN